MHNTSASKLPARKLPARKLPARKLLGAIIAATLFMPKAGFTLGLGEIEVNSALNQQLDADIELLSTTPEDAENIIVKLASRKAFTRAGLDRPYALNDLRFKAEVIDGVPHITVTSGSPIREPFLNFLVEIDWPNGHLLREYTVLLDPPVFMTQAASAPVQQVTSDSRPSRGNIYSAPVVTAPAQPAYQYQAPAPVVQQPVRQQQVKQPRVQAAPVVRQPVKPQVIQQQVQAVWNPPAPTEYRIKAGDTAWRLAEAMRPDQSISVQQMMVALLRHNPESFIDGNINGLRRGYVLRVPDYAQIASVDKANAIGIVKNQSALWRQYQQTQVGGQLASAMETSSSDIADLPTAKTYAVKEDEAHLEIVSAGSGASTGSAKDPTQMTAKELRAELALARERIETERVEKEGLLQKVTQLEQNSKKMKGMLSIEDDQLSGVQSLNLPTDGSQAAAKLDGTLADLKDAANLATEDAATGAQDAAQSVADKANEMAEGLTNAQTDMSAENADDALFVDETATQNAAATTEQVTPNNSQDALQPQPASTGPQNWIDKIMNNPTLAAAAGGGLLLLLGLFGWMFKRGKPEEEMAVTSGFDSLEDFAEEVAEEQAAIPENDEDTSDSEATTSMDASDDTDKAVAEDDTAESDAEEEPRDDVIAEADVYLAYGIYQQAEELLTQAIADNPDRNDYRLKLAETHYASKNADAFIETATELKGKVEEDSSIWKKTLVMGQDLCAHNEMFQGTLIGDLDLDSVAPQAPEMDLDLGLNETNPDLPEIGGLDDAGLELPEVESLAEVDGLETDELETNEIEPAEELEFDLSDTGAVEPEESVVEENEFSLDIDASELDIADATEDSGETETDFGVDDVAEEEISLDLTAEAEALNIVPNTDIDDVEKIEDTEDVDLDLTNVADSFDLDLDDDTIEIVSDSAADEDDFDLSSLDDVDEISTKLDLARAYLDMGDTEGTRSILEEVVAEGNDDQKHEANSLMAKLG